MTENVMIRELGEKPNEETVIIGYGANLLPAGLTASQALRDLVKVLNGHLIEVTMLSRLWRSQAWPDVSDPPFVNAVILARTQLEPDALLASLHDIEAKNGRVRTAPNAPRTMDLDLIAYGDRVSSASPVLPHPRATERAFVMGPLCDVWADWRDPLSGRTARELYELASVGRDAEPLAESLDDDSVSNQL